MLHSIPVCEGVRKPSDCKCYKAVMRTFKSMSDEPRHIAMEAALRVYRYHHPDDNFCDAALTVESWVSAGRVH